MVTLLVFCGSILYTNFCPHIQSDQTDAGYRCCNVADFLILQLIASKKNWKNIIEEIEQCNCEMLRLHVTRNFSNSKILLVTPTFISYSFEDTYSLVCGMWPESQILICVWVTSLCDSVHKILYSYRLSIVTVCDWVISFISMDTTQFLLSVTSSTEFSCLRESSVLRCWRMRRIRMETVWQPVILRSQ